MDQADVDGTYMCLANPDLALDETNNTTRTYQDNANMSTSSSGTLDSQSSPTSTSSHSPTTQPIDETQSIEVLKKNLAEEEEFRPVDHKEPIHIFLKVKPLTTAETRFQGEQILYDYHGETGVSVRPPTTSCYSQKKQTLQTLRNTIFQFSYVFRQEISQKQFYAGTIQPCIEKFFGGDNLLIFSYGVTNSGKTYTMQGSNTEPGLIPRTLDYLFETIKSSQNSDDSKEDDDSFEIFRYKPSMFNEIVELTDIKAEMAYKAKILSLSSIKSISSKGLERTESHQNMAEIGSTPCSVYSLSESKKFGSLDSLSLAASVSDLNSTFAPAKTSCDSQPKIYLPENKKYAVWISFYELYNDKVYDLLTLKSAKSFKNMPMERPQLKVREDVNKVPYVEGLTYIPISNTQEAIKILKYGEKNLQKASNTINLNSSRSHGIFCLKIVALEDVQNKKIATVNQLSFCDLAGLERSKQTEATGKTAKEASGINTSLLSLSRCINAMIANQKNGTHKEQVPYRINKLTRLFQAYFEGRGMVKMIVNFNPSAQCFDESVGVLKFAAIANQIQISLDKDEKFRYEIESKKQNNSKSRLTVAWDSDSEHRDSDDENEELEDSDDSNEESESENETQNETVDEEETMECESDEELVTASEEDTSEDESEESQTESESGTDEDESEDEDEDEDEDEEEEEDEDEEEEEEEEEEEDDEGEESVIEKKNIRVIGDDTSKSIVERYSSSKLDLNTQSFIGESKKKATQFKVNDSLANKRKSIIESEMTKEQLIEKIRKLQEENLEIRRDRTRAEGELRKELVTKWATREEEQETFYQDEIKKERKQVENIYLKRMEMLERVLERKCQEKLDELRKEKDDDLQKHKDMIIILKKEARQEEEKYKKLETRLEEMKVNKSNSEESIMSSTVMTFSNPVKVGSSLVASFVKEERLSQSRFEHPLKLEEDSEDESEDESEEETCCDETEYEETQMDENMETECSESDSETNKSVEEASDEEEVDESVVDQNLMISKCGVEIKEIGCQYERVEFKSVETWCNLMEDEMKELEGRLKMKSDECELVNVKFLAKVDLVEKLTSDFSHIENEHSKVLSELNSEKAKLKIELEEAQINYKNISLMLNTSKTNLKMSNERYEILENKHNQTLLDLEEKQIANDQLSNKIVNLEKIITDSKLLAKNLEEILVSLKEDVVIKETEIKDLVNDISEHGIVIENKNKRIEELENDLQFNLNQIEKLEFKLIEAAQSGEMLAEEVKCLKNAAKKFEKDKDEIAKTAKEIYNNNTSLDTSHKKVPIQTDSNVSWETLERIKALDKESDEELVVSSKVPVKGDKLKKSSITRSGSMLTSEKLAPVVKKKISCGIKSKSGDIESEEAAVKIKTKKKASVSSKKKSDDLMEIESMGDVIDVMKPLKSNLTKKKSTLNRLADIISKSPILEPLRNRPKRGGSTLVGRANESVSQHDASVVSLNGTAVLGEKAVNSITVKKKKSDVKKKVSEMDLKNIENVENIEEETLPARKTRTKKAAKT